MGDAVSVHLNDLKPAILKLDTFSHRRDVTETEKEISGESLESGVRRELDPVDRNQIPDRCGAFEINFSGLIDRGAGRILQHVEFIRDISPTICSMTSSTVTRPATVPNSSTTSAMCV